MQRAAECRAARRAAAERALACSGGSSALYVIGSPHSAGFYYACGFELLGQTETRFGIGLLMRKSLVGLPPQQ